MATTLIPSFSSPQQAELIEINDSPSPLPSLFDQLIAEYAFYDSQSVELGSCFPVCSLQEPSSGEQMHNLETEDIAMEKAANETTRIDWDDKTSNEGDDSIEKQSPPPPKIQKTKQRKSHQRPPKEKPLPEPLEKESSESQPPKSKKIVKAARFILQPFWSFSWNLLNSS